MRFTPVIWDVATDAGEVLGYIELVEDHYEATAEAGFGSREEFLTYDEAGAWLEVQQQSAHPLIDLVTRPNALTDPRAV
jgi:hypothetical protein